MIFAGSKLDLEMVKKNFSKIIEEKFDSKYQDFESDYDNNWNESFLKEITGFLEAAKAFEKAQKENDEIAQIYALVCAKIKSQKLYNFFQDIFEDVRSMLFPDNIDWPEIPDNYEIPEKFLPKESVLRKSLGKC